MILSQLTYAQSQPAGAPANVAVVTGAAGNRNANGGSTFVGNAGKYDINQVTQDNTAATLKIMDQNRITQDIDRAYLSDVANRLNAHLTKLSEYQKQLTILSQQSATEKFVALNDYMSLVNNVNQENQLLVNDINTQTLLTRESLPSYGTVEVGAMKSTVPTVGTLDMKPLTSRVDGLRSAVMDAMSKLTFPRMQSALGQPCSATHDVLTPTTALAGQNIRILTDDQIQEYSSTIQEKTGPSAGTKKALDNYADVTVNLINNFFNQHGSRNMVATGMIATTSLRRRSSVQSSISQAFMFRSYLRKQYKMYMGAIQTTDYPKMKAKFEVLKIQPMAQIATTMRRVAATNQNQCCRCV